MAYKTKEERFWPKVNKQSGQFGVDNQYPTECWVWTAACYPNGYGWFALGKRSEGTIGAHKMSWIFSHGVIKQGLNVLHKCDNIKCVRLDHLFAGTQSENIRDMHSKGRGQMKLHENDIRQIRLSSVNGASYATLAIKFNVSKTMIAHIVHRRKWTWVE